MIPCSFSDRAVRSDSARISQAISDISRNTYIIRFDSALPPRLELFLETLSIGSRFRFLRCWSNPLLFTSAAERYGLTSLVVLLPWLC